MNSSTELKYANPPPLLLPQPFDGNLLLSLTPPKLLQFLLILDVIHPDSKAWTPIKKNTFTEYFCSVVISLLAYGIKFFAFPPWEFKTATSWALVKLLILFKLVGSQTTSPTCFAVPSISSPKSTVPVGP